MNDFRLTNKRDSVIQRHQAFLEAKECQPVHLPSGKLEEGNILDINSLLVTGPGICHIGKFLLARAIGPVVKRSASNGSHVFQVVLDDPNGENALILYITANDEDEQQLQLSIGSVFTLKNPYLMTSSDEKVALLCENASNCISVLQKDNALLDRVEWKIPVHKSNPVLANKLKEEGNVFFRDGKYQEALKRYCMAIEEDPSNAICYSNRSAVYALLGQPEMALKDAETGLNLDPSNSRLHYRKAFALYLLKRYQECTTYVDSDLVKMAFKGDKEIAKLAKKANQAYRESKLGKYDLIGMCNEARRTPFLDHAEYFDETMIELKPTSGYPHAMVAKRPIAAGSLVCTSKALFYSPNRLAPLSLPRIIAEKLNSDPSLGRLFYKLYAGSELRCLEKYDENDPVQLARIYRIVDLYFYNDASNDGIGFWMVPSFINSICVDSNCDRCMIGDFMIVRANRDVSAGEQLLLQLYPLDAPFEERDQQYRKRGNVCNCRLCLIESSESPSIRKRVRHILRRTSEINNSVVTDPTNLQPRINELIELLNEARSIRPNVDFNPLADWVNAILASLYYPAGKIKEAIPINEDVFEKRKQIGWVMNTMEIAQTLATQYLALGNQPQTKQWIEKLKIAARLHFGDEKLMPYLISPSMAVVCRNLLGFSD